MTAIGIDFGTTSCSVGILNKGKVEIFINDEGNKKTPSYLGFSEDQHFFGDLAKLKSTSNPLNTVYNSKRLIGTLYNDSFIKKNSNSMNYKIKSSEDNKSIIEVDYKGENKKFYIEEICSIMISKLKEISEKKLGRKVNDAVISIPDSFSKLQKDIIRDSCKIAGLNVLRMLPVTSASALAYSFHFNNKIDKTIAVFDLGGGSCECSILSILDGYVEKIASKGIFHLGGEDFTFKMIEYFIERFNNKYNCDIKKSPRALMILKNECEKAKKTLSTASTAYVICDSIFEGHDLMDKISRSMFENLNEDLFLNCIEIVKDVLKESNISIKNIDDIFLVGGSSRIPKIQDLLRNIFQENSVFREIDPEEAVIIGTTLQAAILKGDDLDLLKDLLIIDNINI